MTGIGREVAAAGTADQARVTVVAGPLAGPVLARVVGIGASRADLPVDRLDDALLLADVIAASAPALMRDGRVVMSSRSLGGRLELSVGPLRPGGARKLLDGASGHASESLIDRLASETRIVGLGDGELLVIDIAA